ncbi:MAG: hypothetical protein EWM72_00099 [Nitrospira sp.]|nr:MAG: hypothetical protein EWM72_00099 [Nitrospira sp.]
MAELADAPDSQSYLRGLLKSLMIGQPPSPSAPGAVLVSMFCLLLVILSRLDLPFLTLE